MALEFCSLSSGSSGNCYYLGNGFHGILIDAGISGTSIRKNLKNLGISMQSILGVLITHNHTDHVRGLYQLVKKSQLPVFTTSRIWKSILSPDFSITSASFREIRLQQSFHMGEFALEAFPVFHDAPETIGFHIQSAGKKITLATDLGHICSTAAAYIKAANLLVIESNYDEQMLLEGPYPPYLKARIRSDHGHLGNHQTSDFLAHNLGDHLEHICLAHLSKNSNTPERALHSLSQKLREKGIHLNGKPRISVLQRDKPSDMIHLTD